MCTSLLLQAGGAAPQATPGLDPFMLLMPVAVILFFYMAIFRPQKKRDAERRKTLEALQKGDLVILRSGILGKVDAIRGTVVTVCVDESVIEKATERKTRIFVLRSAVDRVVKAEDVQQAMSGADKKTEG